MQNEKLNIRFARTTVHTCNAIPEEPEDGQMVCPSTPANFVPVLGEVCQFSCDEGYNLLGSSERSCEIGGSFSGDEASCQSTFIIHVY